MPTKEPFILKDFKILELKKFEGTTKQGKPYVKFAFNTDHEKTGDNEFHYFADVNAPETWPYEGVHVKEMVGEKGSYQGNPQYNVKTILYAQVQEYKDFAKDPGKGKNIPNGTEKNSPIWFCVSYAKDLQVARLAWMKPNELPDLSTLADEVERVGTMMYDNILNKIGRVEK